MAFFDQYANRYRSVLNRRLSFAGAGVEDFVQYRATLIRNRTGPQFSGKILDYGCGIGLLTKALGHELPLAELVGYDLSEQSIHSARQGVDQGARFTSDEDSLGDGFDLAILANVLHHILPVERQSVMWKLVQRLSPGGRMMVFEHNPLNPVTRWIVDRCEFDRDAVLLTSRACRRLLHQVALDKVAANYTGFFVGPLARLATLETHLGWCPLGAQYVATGIRRNEGVRHG